VNLQRRILLLATLVVVLPLLLLGVVVRTAMSRRLAEQYDRRLEAMISVVQEDLDSRRAELVLDLATVAEQAAADNAFTLAVEQVHGMARFLENFGESTRRLTGLDTLLIVTGDGRVLYPPTLDAATADDIRSIALGLASAPEGCGLLHDPASGSLSLAVADSLVLGSRVCLLAAARGMDRDYLAGLADGRDVDVSIVFHGGAISTDPHLEAVLATAGRDKLDKPENVLPRGEYLVRALPFPPPAGRFVSLTAMVQKPTPHPLVPARLVLTHPSARWRGLLRELDLWLLAVVAATLAAAMLLAAWLSRRVSRPLRELARGAGEIDLDRPEATFPETGGGETELLGGVLNGMVERLRSGALRLRDAEARAVRGDLARQVNHDIRNGFTPLRNVLRHLGQVAESDPDDLARVFSERRGTLESGLGYLEELADNYARLSSRTALRPCDLSVVAREAATGMGGEKATVIVNAPAGLPRIQADPTALRRAVQNLVRNAVESLGEGGGRVVVAVEVVAADSPGPADKMRLTVADDGRGMDEPTRDRIFDDFFTTCPDGTGLGLSVVRRVVADHGGHIEVDSRPGQGTTFTLIFPAAAPIPEDDPR